MNRCCIWNHQCCIWNHQWSNCSRRRAISALGRTPTIRSTSRPPWKKSSAGMLRMLNRFVVAGFSSILSLAMRTRPAISAARSSNIGLIARQGPHHGAHRSTSTGMGDRSTSAAKVASVTTTGAPFVLRGALHFPQTGRRPCCSRSCGTRFFAPQAGHGINSASAILLVSCHEICGAANPRGARTPACGVHTRVNALVRRGPPLGVTDLFKSGAADGDGFRRLSRPGV